MPRNFGFTCPPQPYDPWPLRIVVTGLAAAIAIIILFTT